MIKYKQIMFVWDCCLSLGVAMLIPAGVDLFTMTVIETLCVSFYYIHWRDNVFTKDMAVHYQTRYIYINSAGLGYNAFNRHIANLYI